MHEFPRAAVFDVVDAPAAIFFHQEELASPPLRPLLNPGVKSADESDRLRKLRSKHLMRLSAGNAQVNASRQDIASPLIELGTKGSDESHVAHVQVPRLVLDGP